MRDLPPCSAGDRRRNLVRERRHRDHGGHDERRERGEARLEEDELPEALGRHTERVEHHDRHWGEREGTEPREHEGAERRPARQPCEWHGRGVAPVEGRDSAVPDSSSHRRRHDEAGEERQDEARRDGVAGDALLAPDWHRVQVVEQQPRDPGVQREVEGRRTHPLLEQEKPALRGGHAGAYSVFSPAHV